MKGYSDVVDEGTRQRNKEANHGCVCVCVCWYCVFVSEFDIHRCCYSKDINILLLFLRNKIKSFREFSGLYSVRNIAKYCTQ